jgi:hypothetical protein
MCGGGGAKRQQQQQAEAATQAQEQSMALQREQMAMQQEQFKAQQAQYQEQLAISNAPPPPAPEPVAMAARNALEMPTAQGNAPGSGAVDTTSAQTMRAGVGRKKLRTDLASIGLGIPGVA